MKTATRILVDEVRSGSSYISNSDMRVHFGLGKVDKIEWVEVRWPSGLLERFSSLSVDQIHTLERRIRRTAEEAEPKAKRRILFAGISFFLGNCMVRVIPSPSFT